MFSRYTCGRARFAALAWIIFALPLEAQLRPTLTLEQAMSEALEKNLNLSAERLEMPVAGAEMIGARLRPNPTITYEVGNLSAQRIFGTHPNDTTDRTVVVGVPIETGGKRRLRIENAGLTERIVALRFQDAVRRLRVDVATAYSDAVRLQQRSQLAHANADLLKDVAQVNEVRVNAGAAAPFELTRSQTAMYLLRGEAARADVDLATAHLRLGNVIGRYGMGEPTELVPEVRIDLPKAADDLQAAEAQALARRPDLLAARLTTEQRGAALRLAIAQSKVDPIAGFSYTRKGVAQIGSSYGLNITIPLQLFDRNQGDIARTRAEKDVAETQVRALEQQVRTEVRTAYGQYQASKRILAEIRADLLPAAQKSRDAASYVYRTHASSLLEFLDAERAYNDTMDSYFDGQAAARTAAFQLDAAMGGSHEDLQ